jgi:hypothetical protein
MATATAATTMATATAAAATFLSFVDADVTSVDFRFVESVDGSASAFIIHFNKTKTAGASRVTIKDNFGRLYVSVLSKKVFERLVVDAPGEVSDKKILHTVGWALSAWSSAIKVQPPESSSP